MQPLEQFEVAERTENIDMVMKMKVGPADMDIKSSAKSDVSVTHP